MTVKSCLVTSNICICSTTNAAFDRVQNRIPPTGKTSPGCNRTAQAVTRGPYEKARNTNPLYGVTYKENRTASNTLAFLGSL